MSNSQTSRIFFEDKKQALIARLRVLLDTLQVLGLLLSLSSSDRNWFTVCVTLCRFPPCPLATVCPATLLFDLPWLWKM